MKTDIRKETCIIIRKNKQFLQGNEWITNRPLWTQYTWNAWRTRDKKEAAEVAKLTGGVMVDINREEGEQMNATQEILDAISDFENGRISAGEYKKILDKFRDVEPVVRCKDCKYGVKAKNGLKQDVIECNNSDLSMMGDCHFPNWYCADGEPKDGDRE